MAKKVPALPAVVPDALPPTFKAEFLDITETKSGPIPAPTMHNTVAALLLMPEIECWQDMFTGKKYVGGNPLNTEVGGQMNDEAVTLICILIRDQHGFNPNKNHMFDAVNMMCRANGRHPIKEYLYPCMGRVLYSITMLPEIFGVVDMPFTRAVSRIVMVASVRRIYEPGAKFDYMPICYSLKGGTSLRHWRPCAVRNGSAIRRFSDLTTNNYKKPCAADGGSSAPT